jgi:hypothetical protein
LTMTGTIAATDDFYVVFQGKAQQTIGIPEKQTNGTYLFGNAVTIDEDGATVLTVDRATSDGTIIDLQKDGTTVGNIDSRGGVALTINSQGGNGRLSQGGTTYYEWNTTRFAPVTDTVGDLGRGVNRWGNLYLSGGVYLGGTGSANYLDDYEEGGWTPTLTASTTNPTVTYTSNNGKYTKIGNVCHASFQMRVSSHSGGSGTYQVSGLPFASVNAANDHIGVSTAGLESHPIGSTEQLIQVIDHNTTHIRMLKAQNNAGWGAYTPASNFAIYMSFTYPVG